MLNPRMQSAPKFNPEMLVLAREAAGMTQADLARAIGTNQTRVSKLEEGLTLPGDDERAALSKALGKPAEVFGEAVPHLSGAISFYRKHTSIPSKALRQHNAAMQFRWMEMKRALAGAPIPRALQIPYLPPANKSAAIEAAREVRKQWAIQSGPVKSVIQLLERAGCIVDYFDFDDGKLDGLAIGGGGDMPVIFVNQRFPRDRVRLTLAHELGHLVMHRELREGVEEEAWAFAAEFLMPSEEIRRELAPVSIEHLGELKCRWGVSIQALLMRATELGLVSARGRQYLWMHLGRLGYRTTEPFEDRIPIETPTPFDQRMITP